MEKFLYHVGLGIQVNYLIGNTNFQLNTNFHEGADL